MRVFLVKNVKKPRMIFLVASLLLTGCWDELKYLYVIDVDNQVCAKREITDHNTYSSRWVKDLPLQDCDGNVSITAEDFAKYRGKK